MAHLAGHCAIDKTAPGREGNGLEPPGGPDTILPRAALICAGRRKTRYPAAGELTLTLTQEGVMSQTVVVRVYVNDDVY